MTKEDLVKTVSQLTKNARLKKPNGDYVFSDIKIQGQILMTIMQHVAEVIEEDEKMREVPPNPDDSYQSLKAQTDAIQFNQEAKKRNALKAEYRKRAGLV